MTREYKTSQANSVMKQIEIHYSGCYINYSDLIRHLMNNKIDNFELSEYSCNSLTTSYDHSMSVFYYSDNSILIVGPYNIQAGYLGTI